ncbi:hypothetical protein RM572_08450 [Streptomyces sp. DSM 42041]|uniref:Uncharacterized protein n=1 Tax=Streptomyces hazeniae TaxID=3075538 RepID=A0ABU2NRE3_9ACTN|nr:hypothetical protein [Streptomyces sp. DSM 42041]MDT0378803.1 hypothetical protein [Streptomyces sp. DSM 42041]
MKIFGWVLLGLGLYFLAQGFVMPLVAERSDVESLEFQQIREAGSHLGIGLMIGAVACGVLARVQGGSTPRAPQAPPYPAQAPYGGQQPQVGWGPPHHG